MVILVWRLIVLLGRQAIDMKQGGFWYESRMTVRVVPPSDS